MNEIDVRNIKRIIRFRSSQPYETGGEIATSDLENKSTEELGRFRIFPSLHWEDEPIAAKLIRKK